MVQRIVRSETEKGAMATERLSMRQIREILRQKWTLDRTHRQVAAALRVGLGTVSTVERRARAAGLDWGQVETLSEEALEARVYGPPTPPTHHRIVPDCAFPACRAAKARRHPRIAATPGVPRVQNEAAGPAGPLPP